MMHGLKADSSCSVTKYVSIDCLSFVAVVVFGFSFVLADSLKNHEPFKGLHSLTFPAKGLWG